MSTDLPGPTDNPYGTPQAGNPYGTPQAFPSYGTPPPPPMGWDASGPGYGRAMKRRNELAVWIGLPLITLGVYHYVWYYKIHAEMARLRPNAQVPVAGPMLVILLLSWTVVAPLVSYYNTGVRIREAQQAAGIAPTCNPLICLLLTFVLGLNTLYMQVELNRINDRYGAPEGAQVPLAA